MSSPVSAPTVATPATRLLPGAPAPELDVPLARGGRWRLFEQSPQEFTLILVFRGVHCSFCKPEVEKLQLLKAELAKIGISAFAVSMDDRKRADRTLSEWAVDDLPLGHALTEEQARAWGLYLSRKVKPSEPDLFCEPGAFLIRPDGTLYAQFQSTAPWLRLDLDTLVRGIQLAMERDTPPRGGD